MTLVCARSMLLYQKISCSSSFSSYNLNLLWKQCFFFRCIVLLSTLNCRNTSLVIYFTLYVSAHLLAKGCSHFLVASYTLSLLQVYFEPATLLNRAATTPGTSCPTLFEKCVGSLTSHGILELKEL